MYKYLLPLLLLVSLNGHADHKVSEYWVDVSAFIPTDAKCDSRDSDVLEITTNAAFTSANLNNTTYTFFCVHPGVDGGNISITASGTALAPKVLRYYDDGAAEILPVRMDEADRATVDQLHFDGGEFWIIDRLTVHGTGDTSVDIGDLGGSDDIHLQRMLVEGSGGGAGQVNVGRTGFVLQGSVVRNSSQATDSGDDHCVNLANGDDIRIIDNELYDCTGDMLQLHGQHQNQVIIAGNELYVSSALRTDCAGTINGTGNCLAAENALDFKRGGDDTFPYDVAVGNYVLVKNNIMWGFDRTDDGAFVTGGGGDDTIIIHQDAKGIVFEGNFVDGMGADPTFGIVYANPTSANITFKNNLFYNLDIAISGSSNGGTFEYYQNTFLDVNELFFGNEDTSDYLCNVLINVTDQNIASLGKIITSLGTGSASEDNAFYNSDTTPLFNSGDVNEGTAAASNNTSFTYTKRHITAPTTETVLLAVTDATSPHYDTCTAPTEAASRGVDNITQILTTRAGFFLPPSSAFYEVRASASDHDTDPGVSYIFTVPETGVYQFWFEATTTGEYDNSISWRVGEDRSNVILSFDYPVTEWRRGKLNLSLNRGTQILIINEREDGIVIGDFIITNDPDFVSP